MVSVLPKKVSCAILEGEGDLIFSSTLQLSGLPVYTSFLSREYNWKNFFESRNGHEQFFGTPRKGKFKLGCNADYTALKVEPL
jgi:hypothetical protein